MRTIKCLIVVSSILAFLQVTPNVYAGEISIELSERLQYAQNEEYISAIIRMANQADLNSATKGIVGGTKRYDQKM